MQSRQVILRALALSTIASTGSSYLTEPFQPPVFNTTEVSGAPLAPGFIFLTPLAVTETVTGSGVIMTNSGDLVWSTSNGAFNNLLVSRLFDEPVLHYWNGSGSANPAVAGHGYGQINILDTTYTKIYTICPDLGLAFPPGTTPDGCQADLHESFVTNHGTLVVSAYNYTQADLTSIGGPTDGYIYDCLFFEIDVKTKEILFSWSAIEHVPVSATKLTIREGGSGSSTDAFDYFHINSIQPIGEKFLVNSRHTWTVYMIDRKGQIEWEFEGSHGGDFYLPTNGAFAWEHHVRAQNVTEQGLTLHMFDNANDSPSLPAVNQTLGLEFHLDLVNRNATTLLKHLADPKETVYSTSQGTFDPLPNGNVLMGFGVYPIFKEYGPAGDVRSSTQWGNLSTVSSYRTFKQEWAAEPYYPPSLVAESGSAYMSWNGATNVKSWNIYEGTTNGTLKLTQRVPNAGFETEACISNATRFVQVSALWEYRGKRSVRKSSVVSVI